MNPRNAKRFVALCGLATVLSTGAYATPGNGNGVGNPNGNAYGLNGKPQDLPSFPSSGAFNGFGGLQWNLALGGGIAAVFLLRRKFKA